MPSLKVMYCGMAREHCSELSRTTLVKSTRYRIDFHFAQLCLTVLQVMGKSDQCAI